jgi:ATP-dependent helicase/nuclease subunit A
MAERKAIPPLKPEQAQASRPHAHVWLSASAGTGKTHVLSARVLRLLLADVAPECILCLTFTKAGAAEMAERVHGTLARWVQIDETALFHDLEALGEASGPEARARARLLFAKVLDATGGGLKIQTIHSFCQSLLAAFPLEAGLVPGFKPLDDRAQSELSRAALIAMIEQAERSHDSALIGAIEALALRLGEQATVAYFAKCVPASRLLDALPENLASFLLLLLDLPDDVDAYIAAHCADEAICAADVRSIAAANRDWGTKTGLAIADTVGLWLNADLAERVALIEPLLACLVTKDGLAKNRNNEKLLVLEPGYTALAESIGAQLRALADLPGQVAYARAAAQGLHAGRAYARAYAAAKRLAGVVDFDDLIGRASELLQTPGIADWIRYKLDQRIDHMLVDEAQDTNTAQWDLVEAIVEDYFEAEPDDERGVRRTLFVVGDTKQAIFGFQGTSPRAFVDALQRFQARAGRTGHVIDELPLALSFRSMPAVLDVVDAMLDAIGHDAIGLPRPAEHHRAARSYPGQVLLLPPTMARLKEEDDEEAPESDEAGDDWTWLADHERLHAERIARQVKAWLDPRNPLMLRSKGRPARPGDILILLRSRGALSRLIVARLYEAGVPVAGVDRLRLQAPLAVQDLLAALRFAVQPEDDLNLANLLVSPLIGWSQDDLLARAVPREGSLWSHLRATLADEIAPLRGLLNAADFTTPYRYLEAILSGPLDGRRKLVARLGEEARDAIDELLNAALGFEADDHPSLQRFIDWFDRGDADIKRELAEGGDMVRVMTVHGSKGLEAPVVILADAAFDPGRRPRGAVLELPVAGQKLPLIPPSKAEACTKIAEAMQEADAAETEEHWRLLYVGMTRAEEMLVVTGALGSSAKGEAAELSWHRAVERALTGLGAATVETGHWGQGLLWTGPGDLKDAPPPKEAAPAAEAANDLPPWLRMPAPVEARPPRPLAPSAAPEDDVPDPPPDAAMRRAAERGRLIHALFERLPDVAPADRRAAADRWLAGAGQLSDPAARSTLIDHALAVIDDPAHAALFSPDALAEAPIAAVVGEQVIAGTVDRLLVTDTLIHVVDFKTGRAVPADAASVAPAHVRQVAAYAAALGTIFPDREIRASLLYSAGPSLIDLPSALLAPHKPGFVPAQEKLSAVDLEGDTGVH